MQRVHTNFIQCDFNPRSPHGERRSTPQLACLRNHFNPRSPHGERRRLDLHVPSLPSFQSTLPARGATKVTGTFDQHHYISIHAPRTGSDSARMNWLTVHGISIHAPRTGSDQNRYVLPGHDGYFNPRSPHGERRRKNISSLNRKIISIHAPRTGSDSVLWGKDAAKKHFNPRSPHGERHMQTEFFAWLEKFQSTLPARGATFINKE